MRDRPHILLLAGAMAGTFAADTPAAHACGCLSPPAVTEGQYAVNQAAEQIVFETEPGWVTAHVLIKYAGDPTKFAWIVPVPEVPELGISPVSLFGLLDNETAPDISATLENICPISEWSCAYHEQPHCGFDFGGPASEGDNASYADAGFSLDGATAEPPVTVISQEVVGDYQTVTFRASDATLAVQWLRDNGFIVNNTTSIYMESYIQANMVFVAAKLVPGAGVKAIKPLKLRYRAAFPTVPLILTAVAAQPHLTVTAFIYGTHGFRPMGHPIIAIDPARIAQDTKGRLNYPMVLARTIDEAGGDGFAIEYRGNAPAANIGTGNCCQGTYDTCHIGYDGQCQCPGAPFDSQDCANTGDLGDGVKLMNELATKYTWLTRITTRVSAEEMKWDPAFEPDYAALYTRLSVHGTQPSLSACSSEVLDKPRFNELDARQGCAAMYCGPGSECVISQLGPACACGAEQVAQSFTDLDGKPSVTCVPRVPPVDLRAGGLSLPDACAGVSCGTGTCVDRNGVAVCACETGAAAIVGATTPYCSPIQLRTSSSGAEDFSEPLRYLSVCAPPPPTCGDGGWLVKSGSPHPGVDCGNATPPAKLTIETAKPTCGGWFGCGCQGAPSAPLTGALMSWIVLFMLVRRRR